MWHAKGLGTCPDFFPLSTRVRPLRVLRFLFSLRRNQPNVHEQKLLDNPDHWHGAELSLIIAGNWQYYRSKVLKYLQLIAVITPYTQVAALG